MSANGGPDREGGAYGDPCEDADDADEGADGSTSAFPYARSGRWRGWGLWPPWNRGTGGETSRAERTVREDGSRWDAGRLSPFVLAGVVLLVFPDPATSAAGVLPSRSG